MRLPRLYEAANLVPLEVREDVKPQNLSFSQIAKRVGEEWQHLSTGNKASYEAQASAAKDKYRADLHEYKKTDSYREYNVYLADFKKKNPSRPSKSKAVDARSLAPNTGLMSFRRQKAET